MSSDITLSVSEHVASVEIQRPPNNFFDFDLIREIADTYAAPQCGYPELCYCASTSNERIELA